MGGFDDRIEELLSPGEAQIARKHPLQLESTRHSLDNLQHALNPASSDLHPIGQQTYDQPDLRDVLSGLLLHLIGHPVAKKVLLRWNGKPLNGELAYVYSLLQSQQIELSHFQHLIACIRKRVDDKTVWCTVLQFLSHFSKPRTPPQAHSKSTAVTCGGTPYVGSSGSIQSSDQTRKKLEGALLDEIGSCTYENVQGFTDKYFNHNEYWAERCEKVFTKVQTEYTNGQWKALPTIPTQNETWRWIDDFQSKHLNETPNKYFTSRSTADIKNDERKSQIDILVKRQDVPVTTQHDMRHVLVAGELTVSSNTSRWRDKFIQLGILMRDIFSHQPTRRFVHGFIIWRSSMQLWVYDRSGPFATNIFDIHKEPRRFITVLTTYASMNEEEVGLDLFINQKGPSPVINFPDLVSGKKLYFELEITPITYQPTIVSRATVCYRTFDKKNIIKFSWQSDKRQPEQDILRDLAQHNIQGVPKLLGSCQITTITELRKDLTFSKRHVFRKHLDATEGSILNQQSRNSSLHGSSESVSKKRKTDDMPQLSSKQSRSNSQVSTQSRRWSNGYACSLSADSEADTSLKPFRGRNYTCLAISPAGRPLSSAQTPLELLKAFRDVINTHQSVLMIARYLHRDISDNNIIISEPERNSGLTGLLIDFDMAVKVGEDFKNEKTRAEFMTGTRKFMAIEVLEASLPSDLLDADQPTARKLSRWNRRPPRGIDRTYKHDIESFFYVFLSICISYGWDGDKRLRLDPLSGWYLNDTKNQIAIKRGHMDKKGFGTLILPQFSPRFQGLKTVARRLRDVIFESEEGGATPTPHPSELYSRVLQAFDDEILTMEPRCRGASSLFHTNPGSTSLPQREVQEYQNINNIDPSNRDNKAVKRKLESNTYSPGLAFTDQSVSLAGKRRKICQPRTSAKHKQIPNIQTETRPVPRLRRSARVASRLPG